MEGLPQFTGHQLMDDIQSFVMMPNEPNFSTDHWQLPPTDDLKIMESVMFHSETRSHDTHRMISSDYNNDKSDNGNCKYTLRIKSGGGTAMPDDGYKWRKYGQKSIKNSPYPRSYYRCTNPRCSAKKQVEQSIDDPETLIITYEGFHLHFIPFPSLLLLNDHNHMNHQTNKKHKGHTSQQEANLKNFHREEEEETSDIMTSQLLQQPQQQEGLLEDVVPLLIRKPFVDSTYSSLVSHDESLHDPFASPASYNSFSWSPT